MTLAWTASATNADRYTRALLPRVSRTFAHGVQLLPSRLELPVRLGYLLCRIADTVEDDLALSAVRKAQLLDAFAGCFDDSECADAYGLTTLELTADGDCLALVTATGEVFALYRLLDEATRMILRRWILVMVAGMRTFVLEHPGGIRIADVAEFRRYCYYVAGTVGHLLTDVWGQHSRAVDARVYARLLIARRTENRAAIEPLIEIAKHDIDRALCYIEHIPLIAWRVRLFCVLPVLFAIATMREIERSEAMLIPGGGVKISRAEVNNIVLASSTSIVSNRSLRWLVERVRRRPFAAHV